MKTHRVGALGGNVRVGKPDDLLIVLDKLLERRDGAWWDTLFSERARTLPFVVGWPDESLFDDFAREVLRAGRVLELGCGNGRNAIYLASRNCSVDAVDFSSVAIRWANDLARAAQQNVRFIHGSIFDLDREPAAYDIVYDSGCFHHVPPHRREGYLDLVSTVLKPGGILSMICFNPTGGSGLTDLQVYERRTLGGGLGFTESELLHIFSPHFDLVEMRQMKESEPADRVYGKSFLSAVRLIKR